MDVKKIAVDAGVFFNRAKQFAEEKLGYVEKTEYDAHFENHLKRADKIKEATERILQQTEVLLKPNPGVRVEEYLYEKLDKKKPDRLNDLQLLGQIMIGAGSDFSDTDYGRSLLNVGDIELQLGEAEKEFVADCHIALIDPLKAFLDNEMKTLQRERKSLETRRLDLDACKSCLRRVKTAPEKDRAENDVSRALAEFDRQLDITKELLKVVCNAHTEHLRCLHEFVVAQSTYYAKCHGIMASLLRQIGSQSKWSSTASGPGPRSRSPISAALDLDDSFEDLPITSPEGSLPARLFELSAQDDGRRMRARVLYDYDAADATELSLVADEEILVYRTPSVEGSTQWLMGQRGEESGKIPTAYITLHEDT